MLPGLNHHELRPADMASEPRTINDPGVERPLQPKATHEMLDVYVDPGGTLIDTADDFGFGTSERIVGR
ncbi:hypothetical protein OG705_32985 [Streptomyces sp. NBC_00838]|uniref:hypothetical protein n=1 Tax=Streptomyces sp. NBC_00838 TaxID=2903680 RepID=UPI00386990F0|nr:hypothetical protein OG705_32985 [Streptomyces sp. NBC_00838]